MSTQRTVIVLAAIERCRKRLWAHCYRMTGRRVEADDLSQEAMARAIERGDELKDETAVEGWLFRIATTTCVGVVWYPLTMTRSAMRAVDVITAWVERFNAVDAEGLAALYHENAVNHQVTTEPISGRSNIRQMFVREFARAKMVCIVEQVLDSEPWAVLEWKDPLGLRGCGIFRVEDGLIRFQRGYWDKLSFLRMHNLPIE